MRLKHSIESGEGFDELITPDDDFGVSGLQAESLIRLGLLAVVPRTRIAGSIGSITSERHKRLLERLSKYLLPQKQ